MACGGENEWSDEASTGGTSAGSYVTPGGIDSQPGSTLPAGWFSLRYKIQDLECREEPNPNRARCLLSFQNYYPMVVSSPDYYCSGVRYPTLASCDPRWYPDDLDRYRFVSFRGDEYVCESTFSFGELECFRYFSGDPALVTGWLPDLYCSDTFGLECNEDFPPSDLDDVEFFSIGGYDHVCESTFRGYECYQWRGYGSPKDAIRGWPDYFCDDYGSCSPDDYP